MKVRILRRLARGYGTCSGDYRLMERETGTLCPRCKARADARRAAAAANAAAMVPGVQGQEGWMAEGNVFQ
ncbi:uncharacterized protein B0T23DRAFT_404042 [Neurospora hispaniola]|uniref:Uncharacterized protein n=1 Tax=Neurospora hispaniola TaxID=588809 RepID=A0AAJ0IB18_9PEZI|nr:hypothetical protein B0T23DRAFT_404042 [Neurospora hispaniola]